MDGKIVQGRMYILRKKVVKDDYAASCQTLPGTAAVVNAVKKDINELVMVELLMRRCEAL